jgi:hypothetical protein
MNHHTYITHITKKYRRTHNFDSEPFSFLLSFLLQTTIVTGVLRARGSMSLVARDLGLPVESGKKEKGPQKFSLGLTKANVDKLAMWHPT